MAISAEVTTTNAGSSRAHWFLVCFWYAVCRYLRTRSSCTLVHAPASRSERADEIFTRVAQYRRINTETHAVFGATHSCIMSQNVYLRGVGILRS